MMLFNLNFEPNKHYSQKLISFQLIKT